MPDPQQPTSPAATSGRACRNWNGTRHCGNAKDVHLYVNGPRCPAHTPAAIAGQPEATGQYCAPGRHYCLATSTPCPAAPAQDAETEAAA